MSLSAREFVRLSKEQIADMLNLQDSYRRVFDKASPDVERVIRHLCKVGFVTRSTFVPNDPNQTAMNEGSRRLVLSILRFVHADQKKMVEQIESQYETES